MHRTALPAGFTRMRHVQCDRRGQRFRSVFRKGLRRSHVAREEAERLPGFLDWLEDWAREVRGER